MSTTTRRGALLGSALADLIGGAAVAKTAQASPLANPDAELIALCAEAARCEKRLAHINRHGTSGGRLRIRLRRLGRDLPADCRPASGDARRDPGEGQDSWLSGCPRSGLVRWVRRISGEPVRHRGISAHRWPGCALAVRGPHGAGRCGMSTCQIIPFRPKPRPVETTEEERRLSRVERIGGLIAILQEPGHPWAPVPVPPRRNP
jgi:hypothetical protein